MKIFNEKFKTSGRRRPLSFLGATPRADWRAVLLVAIAAVVAGGAYAELRLSAVREAALAGELRRGGEDTLAVPEAADVVRALAERGEVAVVGATSAATTTEEVGR